MQRQISEEEARKIDASKALNAFNEFCETEEHYVADLTQMLAAFDNLGPKDPPLEPLRSSMKADYDAALKEAQDVFEDLQKLKEKVDSGENLGQKLTYLAEGLEETFTPERVQKCIGGLSAIVVNYEAYAADFVAEEKEFKRKNRHGIGENSEEIKKHMPKPMQRSMRYGSLMEVIANGIKKEAERKWGLTGKVDGVFNLFRDEAMKVNKIYRAATQWIEGKVRKLEMMGKSLVESGDEKKQGAIEAIKRRLAGQLAQGAYSGDLDRYQQAVDQDKEAYKTQFHKGESSKVPQFLKDLKNLRSFKFGQRETTEETVQPTKSGHVLLSRAEQPAAKGWDKAHKQGEREPEAPSTRPKRS